MDGQNCGNCRFFRPNSTNPERPGSCRRYPSQATYDGQDVSYLYPLLHPTKWCGEWQPANPETVEQGAAVMARLVLMGDMTAARALADKLTGND